MYPGQGDFIEVFVHGIKSQKAIKRLLECARQPGCMFVPSVSAKRRERSKSTLPYPLGKFIVIKTELPTLIRAARLFIDNMKKMQVSFEIKGDVIDLTKPHKDLARLIQDACRNDSKVPMFRDSVETLCFTSSKINRSEKLAATTIEICAERGPHTRVICT
jgi:hypothetical protein